ncbi:MAG: DUF4402 domain-containing protein [Candidatus Kryptoniota bacterium]
MIKKRLQLSAKLMEILFLSFIFFVLNESAFSQTTSRTITIDVVNGLSLFVDHQIDFGEVVQNSGVKSLTVNSPNAGHLTITGQGFKRVYVTLTPPSTLVSGSNSIPYTPLAAYNNSADNPSGATAIPIPPGTANFILNASSVNWRLRNAYIYLFGSINVANVPPGTYNGTFVVSVHY